MPKKLQLTREEVEDLRQEMQAAGEWIRQEIKRRSAPQVSIVRLPEPSETQPDQEQKSR